MLKFTFKITFITFLTLAVSACTNCAFTYKPTTSKNLGDNSYLVREVERSKLYAAKRVFDAGYYKRAKCLLLPLACDGNAEAQYAIGYLYYYGYGVAQDTDVGYFWIKRSAEQKFTPAMKALTLIEEHKDANYLENIMQDKEDA